MHAVEIKDLRKTYRSQKKEVHALKGVDLTIPQGSPLMSYMNLFFDGIIALMWTFSGYPSNTKTSTRASG